jgi:hypothetical protein
MRLDKYFPIQRLNLGVALKEFGPVVERWCGDIIVPVDTFERAGAGYGIQDDGWQ